jgi:hypothetical protein
MMMPKYGDAESDIALETAVIRETGVPGEGLTITTAVRLTAILTVGFCLVIAQVALDLMIVFHRGRTRRHASRRNQYHKTRQRVQWGAASLMSNH